ncbi:MAG: nicotinamide riboside transporter PnuC [Mycoplasmataceae bacterium]|jgi:nicotinamide mononucleotide transporter PnuC|nr:nicotinamide riboside transporter PnuC [Mycoplasmataceae bacterium]
MKCKPPWYKKILFFSQWNILEKLIFSINIFITLGLLIYQCVNNHANDWMTWVAFLANIFNIISVILATKKHISCFIWGILAVIGFGGVAFGQRLFGNLILYWAFYIPAQILALYLWKKNSNNKIEVIPKHIKGWQIFLTFSILIAFIALFSWVELLKSFQEFWFQKLDYYPFTITYILDATILVLSIVMTIYVWCRFRERWYVSILVDSCQIALWITIIYKNVNNISAWIMFVSSFSMMTSAIYGVFNWKKQL